jgi:CHAT domain-containing protein
MQPHDRTRRWLDYLAVLATRIRNEPERAGQVFHEIEPPALAADAASDLADALLDRADELDEQDPRLAYALTLVLERWLPAGARPDTLIGVYQRIGFFASRAGNEEQAIQAFSAASAIAYQAGRTEQFLAMTTNLASTLRQMGQVHQALQAYERAIEAITPTTPPALEASVLLNASTAYGDLGRHKRARELNERAVSLLSDRPDQKSSLALALTNLAASYYALGEIAAAEATTLKALGLARETGIPSQEGVALGHLGLIRFRQGRVADAIRYLTTALRMAEDAGDMWNVQHWERDLANVYTWTELPEQALHHFKKALARSRAVGDRRSEGICLLGLGINKLKREREKDLEAGLEYLQQAWQIQQSTGNVLAAVDVARTLAGAYTAEALDLPGVMSAILEGKPWRTVAADRPKNPEALRLARRWLERAQDLSNRAEMPMGGARLVLQEAAILRLEGRVEEAVARLKAVLTPGQEPIVISDCHAVLAALYLRDLRRPDLAAQHLEQAIAGREALSEHLDWSEHRITFRDNFAALYAEMVECALALHRPDVAFAYCERSKLAEMRRLWSLRQRVQPTVPTLSALSHLVAERGTTAIVEFMLAVGGVYVFVIAPGLAGSEQVLVLRDAGLFEHAVQWWLRAQQAYEDLKSPMSAFDPQARERWQAEVEAICTQIGTQLLQPVLAKIAALPLHEIVFVPHSVLHCFPLHAAPLSDTERWVDRYSISYAPSASVLFQQWQQPTVPAAKPATFVGFADSLNDLPMARVEVLQAAEPFPGRAHLYCGQDVSRERVIAALGRADWVHFGCHAVQVLDDGYATGLYLSNTGGGEGDNFLSLFAINRDVQLPDDATIVLSACETGMVTPHLSDEFFSLAGGFIAAGAGTVIATYWKVRDACAALILDRLYAGLRDGLTLCSALRNAELWVRDLNEAQVFDALQRLLATAEDLDSAVAGSVLDGFAARRLTYRPFHHAADWAAFFLAGSRAGPPGLSTGC